MLKLDFKRFLPILFLLVIEVILFICNFKSNTFLVGWDNLFPELGFKETIKRNFFGIWQEYRGLGCIDGMSHAANLPQDLFRLLLSIFLPTNLIRWTYIFLLHFLGGLGVYQIVSKYILKDKKYAHFIALFSALFYQYNLGVIQQFFLPFEVFIIHFAFLPWLYYFILQYLEKGDKKHLLHLFIFSVLSIPQAHVPTLFIVYIFGVVVIFFSRLVSAKGTLKIVFKRILVITLLTFCVNAYWGLPFAYSTWKNSKTIQNSKNFEMGTSDIFYRNNKYGDFTSVATFKGFSLDFGHLDFKTGEPHLMMWPWVQHLGIWQFQVPTWIFFILAIVGLISVILKKKRSSIPFTLIFIFAFFLMGTDIPGIGYLSQFLRDKISLFQTVFRFTFTKFSILYILSYTVLLALGLYYLVVLIRKKFISYFLLFTVYCLLIIYSFPSFQRHFFYENLAVPIPQAYFEVFEFLKSQDYNLRVAILPQSWYWSWTQNKWGTIGSGFIWYGIPQPITDIAFTPWSRENENLYWELDQAIYAKDQKLLASVLDKYDINFIYFDKSIDLDPAHKMIYRDYEEFFSQVPSLNLTKQFDFISIYKYENLKIANNFISLESNLPQIGPADRYDDFDQAFQDYGDYFTVTNQQLAGNNEIYFPFRSLFSSKDPKEIVFQVKEDYGNLVFESDLPQNFGSANLFLDLSNKTEFTIINPPNYGESIIVSPQIYINDQLLFKPEKDEDWQELTVKIPQVNDPAKIKIVLPKNDLLKYNNQQDEEFLNQRNDACERNSNGSAQMKLQVVNGQNLIVLDSQNSENCIKANLPYLEHRFGYLFNLKTENITPNRGWRFNIFNKTIEKSNLDIYLDNDGKKHSYYLVLSPKNIYGLGYTLYFNNISQGREKVVNSLENVNVYQIPYRFLKNIKLISPDFKPSITNYSITQLLDVKHPNPSFYKIILSDVATAVHDPGSLDSSILDRNTTLVLSQSFNPGWKAFYFQGKPFLSRPTFLKDHILVNNWQNGWVLNSSNLNPSNLTIYLFFWPQLLEYLGFALFILLTCILIFKRPRLKS
ncbi:MAG TPA: hypothetical protein VMW29_02270 [Candidatus Bathyarchaeia archaeon]|nr:hypothetical protein [Candidatus Bathyarchaeia archaeon]